MTLRQNKLAKEIPTSRTLAEAGLKAGYSPKSRQIYRKNTKTHIANALEQAGVTKESLTKAYQHLLTLCQKKEDFSTAKGILDSIGKVHSVLKDNATQQVTGIVISPEAEARAKRILGIDIEQGNKD